MKKHASFKPGLSQLRLLTACKHVLDKSNSGNITCAQSTWTTIWFPFVIAHLNAAGDSFPFPGYYVMSHTFEPRTDIVSVSL